MWFTLAVNYAIHGLNIWGYHAVNVAIHLVCMQLVYMIIRRTLLLPYWQGRFREPTAARTAALASILWGVHPLLTETVDYVSQRTELLAGMFCLLTMYFSIRAWSSQRWPWYVAAVAATATGQLAKEQVAAIPIAVLVYDIIFLYASPSAALRRRAAFYAGLGATWSVFAFLTSFGPRAATVGFGLGMSPWDYLRTQAGVLVHYIRLAFWPHPLSISYADWPMEHSWVQSAPSGIFILALIALTAWAVFRRRWPGFAGAWFFLLLAPTSSFVPIITEIAAERRMYLPLLSIVVVIVGFGMWMHNAILRARPGFLWTRPALAAVVAIITMGASIATINRNRQFQSIERILSATLQARPADELARGALMQDLATRGQMERARSLYEEGIRLNPTSESMHHNWGECLALSGEVETAIREFETVLQINPANDRAQRRLGQLLLRQGRAWDAVKNLSAGLQKAPAYSGAFNNLGVALASLHRTDEAISSFRTAIELDPTLVDAHFNLGTVLSKTGQCQEARSKLNNAVHLAPNDVAIRTSLAETLEKCGDISGTIVEYRAIIRLNPDIESARLHLQRLEPRDFAP